MIFAACFQLPLINRNNLKQSLKTHIQVGAKRPDSDPPEYVVRLDGGRPTQHYRHMGLPG
jgi:hypothetical protein